LKSEKYLATLRMDELIREYHATLARPAI
jgi:hypothetical protein